MKRLYYKTAYDTDNTRCGYIIPNHETEYFVYITRRQYNSALKRRTVGGDAGLIFETDKQIVITDDFGTFERYL